MPTTARRTLVALAAALVLATPVLLAGPASAAQVRDSTFRHVQVYFHDQGRAAGHTGNAHAGYFSVDKLNDGTIQAYGFMWDMRCAPGVHLKANDFGVEEQVCTKLHTWEISSTNASLSLNAVTLGRAHIVGDLTLTSLFNTGTPRLEHVDLTVNGIAPVAVYRNDRTDTTFTITRIQDALAAGTFGPMVLGDNVRDNQFTQLRSAIDFHTA